MVPFPQPTGRKILNTIAWTNELDPIFKENDKNYSLLWQYFGSSDGVYRVYPGKICAVWSLVNLTVFVFYWRSWIQVALCHLKERLFPLQGSKLFLRWWLLQLAWNVISNSNWTELSTIQGVITRVISKSNF